MRGCQSAVLPVLPGDKHIESAPALLACEKPITDQKKRWLSPASTFTFAIEFASASQAPETPKAPWGSFGRRWCKRCVSLIATTRTVGDSVGGCGGILSWVWKMGHVNFGESIARSNVGVGEIISQRLLPAPIPKIIGSL